MQLEETAHIMPNIQTQILWQQTTDDKVPWSKSRYIGVLNGPIIGEV